MNLRIDKSSWWVVLPFAIWLILSGCGDSGSGATSVNSGSGSSSTGQTLMGGSTNQVLNIQGVVTTLAGTGSTGSTDATGTAASFNGPYGVTSDGTNLYVADATNNRIRKIVIATGVVTTLAGSGAGTTDGTGTGASFTTPIGITTDGTNLYVADYGNHRIRKVVISTAVVTTIAGSTSGYADGTGTAAQFNFPNGITTDGTNLYVADQSNNRIRKIIISTGVVTTLAGAAVGSSDGTGTSATFNFPTGITSDGSNLYVSDGSNNRIRKIVISTAVVTTLAGAGSGSADGTGTSATFSFPFHINNDGTNLYVVDQNNHRIRKIVIASGVVTTLAGSSNGSVDATGTSAKFDLPRGITTDGQSLFVVDYTYARIRKIQ
jgi:sugar lactone lactonase YvrE